MDNADKPKPGLFERLGLSRPVAVSEEEIKGIVAEATRSCSLGWT